MTGMHELDKRRHLASGGLQVHRDFRSETMEIRWLEDFLKFVDTRNFSRSAEARHTTQPAFSRRIKSLEEWVGATLFDRTTQPISLTPAGERFRPVAEEVLGASFRGATTRAASTTSA